MLTVAIQAGGQSTRMGEDKALKSFLGHPLIQRVVDRIMPIADEIIVTTNHPTNYTFLGLRLVPDLKPGHGALSGLYTALFSAQHPIVAVVGCDMPFASASLLEAAYRLLIEEDADAVVPQTEKGYEPIHAIYRREACLPIIEAAIDAGRWKVTGWFPQVKVRALTLEEIRLYDPPGLAFWNLNTPEEFAEAERRASGQ